MNHPANGLPFDYEHTCNTCAHFTHRKRKNRGVEYHFIHCALDPEGRNLHDVNRRIVWKAMPACSQHKPQSPAS